MKVKLLTTITGTRNGDDWPPRGSVITLPDAEAVDLLNAGLAAPADSGIESAAVEPVESAAIKRAPAKPRKGA